MEHFQMEHFPMKHFPMEHFPIGYLPKELFFQNGRFLMELFSNGTIFQWKASSIGHHFPMDISNGRGNLCSMMLIRRSFSSGETEGKLYICLEVPRDVPWLETKTQL